MINTFNQAIKKYKNVFIAFLTVIWLSGCVTALVAGAVIGTIDVLHDRRTVGEYVDDGAIEVTANNILLSRADIRKATRLKTISWNGILLVTGSIRDEAIHQEVMQKFNNIQGLRQVVDETVIDDPSKFLARSNDAWITTKVKSRLTLKTGLKANRVKVTTTRGSVYLMGIVTQEEADNAVKHARVIRGVKRVVKVFEYK